jgi:DNA-binding HxlR family transcriptional regulator
MTGLRSYEDPCGIARALDAIGERWALLVVRELSFGAKRFSELRQGLPGASPNVLSQRLRELLAHGIVQRSGAGYELSAWGRQLHPILLQLGRWGAQSALRAAGPLSVDALMLALEATFDAKAAADLAATYELRLGDARFGVQIAHGTLQIIRGVPRQADSILETDAGTLRALVFGDRRLNEANIELHGDKRLARAFFRLFSRPSSQS